MKKLNPKDYQEKAFSFPLWTVCKNWLNRVFSRPKFEKNVHKELIHDVLAELEKPEPEPQPEIEEVPKELDDMVKKLKAQGKSEDSAWAIATAALQKQGKMKGKHSKRKKKS